MCRFCKLAGEIFHNYFSEHIRKVYYRNTYIKTLSLLTICILRTSCIKHAFNLSCA